MPLSLLSLIAVSVLGTSFLSGVFGMAGGMVLMGVLVAFLPVAPAMIVHGTAQMTSNGWRAFLWRRHIDFRIFRGYCLGLVLASIAFLFLGFVPDRALVLIVLGALPFVALIIPARYVPQVTSRFGAEVCGVLNTTLQFIAGVSGPMLDAFFIRTQMDRRAVVATKAACQTVSHMAKLMYFSRAIGGEDTFDIIMLAMVIVMAVLGTSLSKFVLEKMTDHQFRRWTQALLLTIGVAYLVQGFYVLWSR